MKLRNIAFNIQSRHDLHSASLCFKLPDKCNLKNELLVSRRRQKLVPLTKRNVTAKEMANVMVEDLGQKPNITIEYIGSEPLFKHLLVQHV